MRLIERTTRNIIEMVKERLTDISDMYDNLDKLIIDNILIDKLIIRSTITICRGRLVEVLKTLLFRILPLLLKLILILLHHLNEIPL